MADDRNYQSVRHLVLAELRRRLHEWKSDYYPGSVPAQLLGKIIALTHEMELEK